MSVAEVRSPAPPNLKRFFAGSLVLHVLVFLYFILAGGIFGVPGPGGGDALYFQLAAGQAQMEDAAADLTGPDQAPVFADADVDPAPMPEEKPEVVEKPQPKSDAIPLKKVERTEAAEKTTPVQGQAREAVEGQSTGNTGNQKGAQGEGQVTILNKKGNSMSGVQIAAQSSGATFNLEMGRIDLPGGNRLTNTVIELHPDGTSDVELVYYHHRTFHGDYSSTRSMSGEGRWWIEGDMWCHQSPVISYNTKDCYHMTMDEGSTVRLYYDKCTIRSSPNCKTGRIAAEGRIE
ncbi:hypothetical protein ACSHT0_01635 [Tepidicaulis sp. LMO-SS28]|uniref:hypothetical protein n=1 Tax=Tepidicaulis sp. LMO-SS28 TaxID=3447455 RepID=UPI003EE2CE73